LEFVVGVVLFGVFVCNLVMNLVMLGLFWVVMSGFWVVVVWVFYLPWLYFGCCLDDFSEHVVVVCALMCCFGYWCVFIWMICTSYVLVEVWLDDVIVFCLVVMGIVDFDFVDLIVEVVWIVGWFGVEVLFVDGAGYYL